MWHVWFSIYLFAEWVQTRNHFVCPSIYLSDGKKEYFAYLWGSHYLLEPSLICNFKQSYDSKVPFITNVSDVSRNKYFFCQSFTCTWKLSDPQKAVVDEVFQYFLWCLDSKGLLLCVIHVVRNTGRSSFITVHSSRSWFDWHSFWKKVLQGPLEFLIG